MSAADPLEAILLDIGAAIDAGEHSGIFAYGIAEEPAPHDHLANVDWSSITAVITPVCAECGLVLEVSGDALVVPFDTCVCGHARADHQTGFGAYTGWCYGATPDEANPSGWSTDQCECEEPRNPEEFA